MEVEGRKEGKKERRKEEKKEATNECMEVEECYKERRRGGELSKSK